MEWNKERYDMLVESAKQTYEDGKRRHPDKDIDVTFRVSRFNEDDLYMIGVMIDEEDIGSHVKLFPMDAFGKTRIYVTYDE